MAINIATQYPGQSNAASTDYPYGSGRDVSSPGAGDGTPFQQAWFNDIYGFLQAILQQGGVTPSGNPDTAVLSDYLTAMKALHTGRLLRRKVLTGSGTYTTPSDVKSIKVTMVGGGGSGCGCSATSTSQTFAGSGGGAGAGLIALISSPAATYAYSVGAGGAQQAAGVSGVSGGNTTFGASLICTGGGGGTKSGVANTAGGVGGTATGGDSNFRGGDGGDGQAGTYLIAGFGGASMFGGGGRMATGTTAYAGRAPGSGGGGAYDIGFTGVGQSGGAGADGTIIIEEFS